MTTDPIHRWYSSVMGFAPALVRTALLDLKCDATGYLLDPFCGTGTTLVESGLNGIKAVGIDANPFSALCSMSKTDWSVDPDDLEASLGRILSVCAEEPSKPVSFSWTPHAVKNGWVSRHVWAKSLAIYNLTRRLRDRSCRRLLQLAVIAAVKETCANVAFGPEIYKRKRKNRMSVKKAVACKVKQIADDLRSIHAPRRR
jgi:hypothetical protein